MGDKIEQSINCKSRIKEEEIKRKTTFYLQGRYTVQLRMYIQYIHLLPTQTSEKNTNLSRETTKTVLTLRCFAGLKTH